MSHASPTASRWSGLALLAVFALGLGAQAVFAARSGIGADQAILYEMGLRALGGDLEPVSKGMSAGGHIPGWLLQLLVAAPLALWLHYGAVLLFLALGHVIGGAILLLTVRALAGGAFAAVFAALYWLAPWRVFHSGILGEAGFLFLPAALHFWAASRCRSEPRFLESLLLGATLTVTAQLHASFLILAVLTALIWLRGVVRIRGSVFTLGLGVGALTMLPTAWAFLSDGLDDNVVPSDGFLGRGFLFVYPVLKGLAYWLRLGALDTGRTLRQTSFFGDDGWMGMAALSLQVVGLLTLVLTLAASWLYFRPVLMRGTAGLRHATCRSPDGSGTSTGVQWLSEYAYSALLALLVVAGLSPVDLQHWHVVIVLHAACVPVAHFIITAWKGGPWMRAAIVAFLVVRLPLIAVIGAGHPLYQGTILEDRAEVVERIGPVLTDRLR